MDLFNLFTYILKVVHLHNLLTAVPHSEDLSEVSWVNLHHAVRLYAVHHGFVLMVIHLQRYEQPENSYNGSDR